MEIDWVDGFQISASIDDATMRITANREGLVSLANILLGLAKERPGSHVHLDQHNSLEDGSCELVIERA